MKRSELKRSAPLARSPMKQKAPAAEPKLRMKKCAWKPCRTPFAPRSMTHKCCSTECALLHVAAEKARKDRKERQEGLAKLKTRQMWLKEAQAAFNAFIRARDEKEPCISCGRFHDGQWHAGHFRSVGAQPALRFDENNVHKQCAPCNNHLAGNVVEYRLRLVRKIGQSAVDLLELEHAPAKYDIADAQRIKETYKAKLKQLQGAAP